MTRQAVMRRLRPVGAASKKDKLAKMAKKKQLKKEKNLKKVGRL